MDQMRRELEDLRAQLDQAQQTILHLTTSKAAELVRPQTLEYSVLNSNILTGSAESHHR